MNKIRELCKTYTNLEENDIKKIIEISASLEILADLEECDAFIDVLSKKPNEAIVVSEGRKTDSIYKDSVVGKKALRINEPGVLRTLKTGEVFKEIKALTQENKFIRQKIHPILNDKRIIGVIILEHDISEEIKEDFTTHSDGFKGKKQKTHQLMNLVNSNELINDNLESAILVYDKNGILRIKNKKASVIYRGRGYSEDIEGMHFDDLSLDNSLFEIINEILEESESNKVIIEEVKVDNLYYNIKRILIREEDLRIIEIVEDITDIKNKEAEIISKSVAIREIHHRVKNNLQTVASLLRIQSRRCDSEEAKVSLQESVSRILAIAATHELLSKDIGDEVKIMKVITALVDNSKRCFANIHKKIDIELFGDDFYVDTDRMTAISLIVNELIQNCYDHAFTHRDSGIIKIGVREYEKFREISVTDNGVGFDTSINESSSLGMSIVKNYISDKLKGTIDVFSNANGTRIKFIFPKKIK